MSNDEYLTNEEVDDIKDAILEVVCYSPGISVKTIATHIGLVGQSEYLRRFIKDMIEDGEVNRDRRWERARRTRAWKDTRLWPGPGKEYVKILHDGMIP